MKRIVVCGGLGCNRVFEARGTGCPTIYICAPCERKINEGIKMTIHERTGRPVGNFSMADKVKT